MPATHRSLCWVLSPVTLAQLGMGVEVCEPIMLGLTAPSHPLESGHPTPARPTEGGNWSESPLSALWPPDNMGEQGGALGSGAIPSPPLPTQEGREVYTQLLSRCLCVEGSSSYADVGC